ncbi:MAG: NAD-dependent epimerase/dehydratase family protein [Planctomycetota bacterium]
MRVLILGGTGFLGRHIVNEGLRRDHDVTLFHRGRTTQDLYENNAVRTILGDRDGGLQALQNDTWDAVIDTCGYVPRVVGDSCRLLQQRAPHYVFISTLAVYAEHLTPRADESAALATIADTDTEVIDGRTYGALKALCEEQVTRTYGNSGLLVRPGLIVGPDDHTDRFTHWPLGIAHRQEMIAPPATTDVEFTDVRDLAAWLWIATERQLSGPFNVSGPTPPGCTFADVVTACQQAADSPATIIWASEEFLLAEDVAPWSDLPLWVKQDQSAFALRSCERALAAGLTYRAIDETVRDTLAWATKARPDGLKSGLSAERERELIARWRAAAQ